MSISENLYNLGALLKTNLETKGINGLTGNEGLTTLANKILDIEGSDSSSKSFFAYVTGNSITLGMDGVRWLNSTGDVVINWGDGTSDTVNNPSMSLSHTYANANGYLIAFNGNIKSLGDTCFYKCSGLTSIIIPNSVVSIGNMCFYKCSGLTSIIIPNKIVSLGSQCFRDCSSLTSVVIPDSVISLGQWCFYNCSGLTSIIIPNSVTYLGTDCFRNCTSLVDYQLYWETQPIQYDSQKMPVNTNTVFTIPYGTTSIYVDAGYPLDKLVERTGAPTDLTLTGDKSIIEKTETAVITALLEDNGLPVYNQNLSYSIKCDSIVLDSGTLTTDVNGQATINYTGTGIGDVSVDISYGSLLQETYELQDLWYYDTGATDKGHWDTSKMNGATYSCSSNGILMSYASNLNEQVLGLDITYPSSDFSMECELVSFTSASDNYYADVVFYGIGAIYHSSSNSVYMYDVSNWAGTNTQYPNRKIQVGDILKAEVQNNTIKYYINNVLLGTKTLNSSFHGFNLHGTGYRSICVKNIKIKPL